ncbi:ABC-2 family transporter protein [candidate division WWE3 bacterium]|uniref:ABC-2 family transporter protein n=1 Tax=candidate division WWE3 bacterium TaxID=2053526 RepID=A0A955LKN1_UNCKA|nr:ABC-2 family transporter protein [candidate division WWE3 bacterium]
MVDKIKRYAKIYLVFVRFSIVHWMEHRADFWLRIIPQAFGIVATFFTLIFLYTKVNNIAGWTEPELILLFGTFNVINGVTFGLNIHNIAKVNFYVHTGLLDLILLNPVSSQFAVSSSSGINFPQAAPIIPGVIMIAYALSKLGIDASFVTLFGYAVMLVCSCIIAYSLWLITLTTSFWIGRVDGLHEVFISVFQIARNPIEIFGKGMQVVLFTVIPVALLSYAPTKLLLGDYPWLFVFASIAAAVISFLLARWFWGFGLKRYSSVSS